MPLLFIFFGLRFQFYSCYGPRTGGANDHEPIHVHIVAGKGKTACKAKFNVLQCESRTKLVGVMLSRRNVSKANVLPDIRLVDNDGLKANELKMAEMVIEENREIIIQQWHTFFGK